MKGKDMDNRPNGRKTTITGTGTGLNKKGSGIGGGPAGRPGGYSGRGSSSGGGGGGPVRAGGSGKLIGILALVALLVFGGGGSLLSNLFGGGGSGGASTGIGNVLQTVIPSLSTLTGGSFSGGSAVSTGWNQKSNVGDLDTTVAAGSRAKRTVIKGSGNDVITIMVYMCGTDLESKHGMASSDMEEMRRATLSSKINLIVYTGGCTKWKNGVSSTANQIHKIADGKITTLVKNDGNSAMTDPATLTKFIRYCSSNYPANRYDLIMWDHGGGSISGFGYDEKNKTSGSMTLAKINSALKSAGTTFDFIGFDACLMATLENALMLEPYADYLIASEETEPGVGWYYTNWLTSLSKNTSMPTLEIGKNIVDDFVSVCNQSCPGQKTTLSVIDLAELTHTVPDSFKQFAVSTSDLISGSEFKRVSDARSSTREFSVSSKIDQIDLVDFASSLGTTEGKELASALLGAVKYNRTSSSITNAYGVSIYFPYRSTGKVKSAVSTYDAIGIDDEYARCIQSFASMETGGQAAGGTTSGIGGLLGNLAGQTTSSDGLAGLFGSLLGGGDASSALGSLFGRTIDMEDQAEYISENLIDASSLVWDGSGKLHLTEKEWGLVHDLLLNVFYDNGEGYFDLGLDNVFSFDEDGNLKSDFNNTWVAIDNQLVAYYYEDSIYSGSSYTVTGRVPALIDGKRVNLIIVFDSKNEYGYIAGARYDYVDGETDTVAKGVTEIEKGTKIQFICDEYDYNGNYRDTFEIGDELEFTGENVVGNAYLPDRKAAHPTYMLTDIYGKEYWTPELPE